MPSKTPKQARTMDALAWGAAIIAGLIWLWR